MFLLDDLLLSPARGLMSVFRNIHAAAQEEFMHEGETIRTQLSEMYLQLESGQLSEDDFDRGERDLLDRLERVEARDGAERGGEDEVEDDQDDDDDENDELEEELIADED